MYVTCKFDCCFQTFNTMQSNPRQLIMWRAVQPKCWTPIATSPFKTGYYLLSNAIIFTGDARSIIKAMMKKSHYSVEIGERNGVYVYVREIRHLGVKYCIVVASERPFPARLASTGVAHRQTVNLELGQMARMMAEAHPDPRMRGVLMEEFRKEMGRPEDHCEVGF